MENRTPVVISISGVSGGGKITLVNELREHLPSCQCLYFDDYDFEDSPQDYIKWVDDGADYDLWNLQDFKSDLVSLIDSGCHMILLDYPFAYKNSAIAPYIDYAVFVHTPLDVAMARRVLRDIRTQGLNSADIESSLNSYLSGGRRAYLEAISTIKPNSDLILDGTSSPEDMVTSILNLIGV